jgi:hypothetical protein
MSGVAWFACLGAILGLLSCPAPVYAIGAQRIVGCPA